MSFRLSAIEPLALRASYKNEAPTAIAAPTGRAAVVSVRGVLTHGQCGGVDYREIVAAVEQGMNGPAASVVLSIDSPGGDVPGLFEACGDIRAAADRAGKPLVAYVDGHATSAAYALACACDRIVCPDTGIVGSIGVVLTREDATEASKRAGLETHFFTSAERKKDRQPLAPLTPDAAAALQAIVDEMSEVFESYVFARRKVDAKPFNGAVFLGKRALDAGLIDEVASLSALLNGKDQGMTKAEILAGLAALAAEGDEESARALAALKGEEPDAEGDEEKPDAEDEDEEPGAEDEAEKPDAEDEDEKPGATSGPLALAAEVQRLSAELKQIKEASAREKLMSSRPDLTAEVRRFVASLPLDKAREALKAIPRATAPVAATVAASTGTRSTDAMTPIVDAASNALAVEMGLAPAKRTARAGVVEVDIFGIKDGNNGR